MKVSRCRVSVSVAVTRELQYNIQKETVITLLLYM